MPSERLKRDMLLLCCLSYLYNINRMINSAHTSRPVRSDTLFINLNGLCIFQTCDLKSDTLILKNELRQRLCNSEQLQCLQRFDIYKIYTIHYACTICIPGFTTLR